MRIPTLRKMGAQRKSRAKSLEMKMQKANLMLAIFEGFD